MASLCFHILSLILINSLVAGVHSSATFTLLNKCNFTVWPGILSNAGFAALQTTGFSLQAGVSRTITTPTSWVGRFWGRTHCAEDSSGRFSCVTGDCGSGKVECTGEAGATPPATLAESSLNGVSGLDFYDVSVVDGYNLPMLVVPQDGTRKNCSNIGCVADLNSACPSELRVKGNGGQSVACRSACEAIRKDRYCCTGAYTTPDMCRPSQYSQAFKKACPLAYSYVFDDRTSTFTCGGGTNYSITFCPSPNTSEKSSSGQNYDRAIPSGDNNGNNSNSPLDGNMVYDGPWDASSALLSRCSNVISGAIAVAAAIWRLSHNNVF